MKCPNCNYERRTQTVKTQEVKRYTRGKQKGEIKEVLEVEETLYADDPYFIELQAGHSIEAHVPYEDKYWSGETYMNIHEVSVFWRACPKCGVTFIEPPNPKYLY